MGRELRDAPHYGSPDADLSHHQSPPPISQPLSKEQLLVLLLLPLESLLLIIWQATDELAGCHNRLGAKIDGFGTGGGENK
eukprot:scaffold65019_cov34-Prasinocladus_malaysianus.AAC.1